MQHLNYQEVRKQFGVVLQEAFLFSGSVRENIAFNNPEIDMNQIVWAAQAADIHEDIQKLLVNKVACGSPAFLMKLAYLNLVLFLVNPFRSFTMYEARVDARVEILPSHTSCAL